MHIKTLLLLVVILFTFRANAHYMDFIQLPEECTKKPMLNPPATTNLQKADEFIENVDKYNTVQKFSRGVSDALFISNEINMSTIDEKSKKKIKERIEKALKKFESAKTKESHRFGHIHVACSHIATVNERIKEHNKLQEIFPLYDALIQKLNSEEKEAMKARLAKENIAKIKQEAELARIAEIDKEILDIELEKEKILESTITEAMRIKAQDARETLKVYIKENSLSQENFNLIYVINDSKLMSYSALLGRDEVVLNTMSKLDKGYYTAWVIKKNEQVQYKRNDGFYTSLDVYFEVDKNSNLIVEYKSLQTQYEEVLNAYNKYKRSSIAPLDKKIKELKKKR